MPNDSTESQQAPSTRTRSRAVELQIAEIELETAKVEKLHAQRQAELQIEQQRMQLRQQRVQLAITFVGLLAAAAALYSSWSTSRKSDERYEKTSRAVVAIGSAQVEQYKAVEDLRGYTAEVASAAPVLIIVPASASAAQPRVAASVSRTPVRRPPPAAPAPPPDVPTF